MVDFRKSLLLLAILFTVSFVASAQPAFQCVANAGVPPIVPAEKLDALVGDLVLNCTGGTATANGATVPQVNVQIFLNTNVTSKLLADPWSEALLLIDEPAVGTQLVCGSAGAPVNASGVCPIEGSGSGAVTYNGTSGVLGPPYTARPNVFQGRQVGANSLVWLGVPIDPPGSTPVRIIRITNVRANANQLGSGSTLIPTQIVMFVSATGATSVPINNPQQIVAFIQAGLTFSVRAENGDSTSGLSFLQCENLNKDLSTDNTKSGCVSFRLRYAENFATAFLIRNVAGGGATTPTIQAGPGVIYNTETGFYNPAFPTITGRGNLAMAGLADHGTRLIARFNNVPAGVRLYVSTADVSQSGAMAGALTAAAADGSGAYSAVAGTGSIASTCPTIVSGSLAEVALVGGSGTATWEVNTADALQIGRLDFGVVAAWTSNTTAGLPALGTATVNGNYAPLSTVGTASASAPNPRFADTSTAKNVFTINSCATNILYPFVTNQAGFDTGLVISNTSKDPFSTPTQSGACTINYYGSTTGGGPAPAAQTSAVVPAGEQAVWTLSSGGNRGIAATPGFQGYIIAQCAFQYAHGYAFISDLGAQRLAQGYLALIMDGTSSTVPRSKSQSEPLNQ